MRAAAVLLVALAALAACGKQAPAGSGANAPSPEGLIAGRPAAPDADKRRATLATRRRVDMQVAADAVAPLFGTTQAACNAEAASECVVLKANLSTEERPHAELKLRAAPAGIARLLARLRGNGGVVAESADSEDLAAPVVDTERQMAMAREYRDSLLALRAKGSNDIKTMMSVNEELARVQSQLEWATGERAHLQQRIATETLDVGIAAAGESERRAWTPLSRALHEFGANVGDAAGSALTFVAYALPWALVLLPLAWGVRWLWQRRRPRA
jgi:Domain of unknown function (DUF4349)